MMRQQPSPGFRQRGEDRRRVPGPAFWAACALGSVLSLVCGCSSGPRPLSSHGQAPGIGDDTPLARRGGTNPNAPFALAARPPQLVTRPTAQDIEAAPPCSTPDLSAYESGSQLNGDRRAVRLSLVNHGSAACRLGGYPSISLLRRDGTLVGNITIEKITGGTLHAELSTPDQAASPAPSPQVLLDAKGGEASFNVGWTTGRDCDEVAQIVVAAPGSTQSFSINHPINVCAGRIQVTAVGDDARL